MDAYKTLGAAGESYFEDRRSEFYGFAFPVATEAEALARIGEIKARFPDARHHVYAYCLREGFCTRFTDDREPQGSAGMPVLDVLRKGSIQDAVALYGYLARFISYRRKYQSAFGRQLKVVVAFCISTGA